MKIKIVLTTFVILFSTFFLLAQQNKKPEPNFENVKYGKHERNTFDIWFADTSKVTPLVIYIHGGGFVNGNKEKLSAKALNALLKSGISVASINYRFLKHAPLPASHHDARRALQFIRAKAEEWKIDKTKIGVFGSSAGAQICMWLAFSDDMANPDATDLIERESTRVSCLASHGGQTSMHPEHWIDWIPEYEKQHKTKQQIFGDITNEQSEQIISEISAISIISEDDPPIFMNYSMKPDAPVPSDPKKAKGWKIHHVNFGIKLKEKMDELGMESYLKYPGEKPEYANSLEFFKARLL